MNKSINLLDPMKLLYNLEGIDQDYTIEPMLYTNFGLGMNKGLLLDNKQLKYLFLNIQFNEPIFVPLNKKITLTCTNNKKSNIIKLYTDYIKYPYNIIKFYPKFFIDNYNRFYGDNNQANYDNGNYFLKFINIDGLFCLINIIFRIDLTNKKIFKINNTIKPFDADKCIACMDRMCIVQIKPCNHLCLCYECYTKLDKQKCPLCNVYIKQIIV